MFSVKSEMVCFCWSCALKKLKNHSLILLFIHKRNFLEEDTILRIVIHISNLVLTSSTIHANINKFRFNKLFSDPQGGPQEGKYQNLSKVHNSGVLASK